METTLRAAVEPLPLGSTAALAASGLLESVVTRTVIAALVFLSHVVAWKSEKVRDGAKIYFGVIVGLVLVVAAYAVGYTVGAASEGGQSS